MRNGLLTEKTAEERALISHRRYHALSVDPCPVLEIGREFVQRTHERMHGTG